MIVEFRKLVVEDKIWLKPHLSIPWVSDTQGIVGVVDGQPSAACVLHNWTHNSVMAHICILRKVVLKHGFIKIVMKHVFETCNRRIMLGSVPSDNDKALAFDTHVGFQEVARIPDGFRDGVDIVLMELRKEDCKWLENNVYEWRKEGRA